MPRWQKLAAMLCIGAVAGLSAWASGRSWGPKDDLGRWQGEWQVAVPAVGRDHKPGARLKPVTVRVTGDQWAYVGDGKELSKYAIALHPEASPEEIDLVQLDRDGNPTPFVLRGIYEIGGDRARVAAAPDPDPRPASFDSDDGPPPLLLERVK
jgi:uncharacterized protein (TIGR03067 family)